MSVRYLCSSIGKKQLMALTGLGWCGFVLSHMAGNLLYLVGPAEFNNYGNNITGNKEIYYAIEAGLVTMLVLHILFAAAIVIQNRRARPIGYKVGQSGSDKTSASLASRTMALSGILILCFIVLHLIHFRFGPVYPFQYKGQEIRDLSRVMQEVFFQGGAVAFYLFCLFVLSFHLRHALWSSLQTLGWIPGGKEPAIRKLSSAFGILVCLGFAVNPIYIYFFQRGGQ
ncbi:MAG: succinate dehydrogenase cytochrome b subunit [Bdellovibrionota bacterium]